MMFGSTGRITTTLALLGALSACGGFGQPATERPSTYTNPNNPAAIETDPNNTIWSAFNRKSNDTNVSVNKYLWTASLEVLTFIEHRAANTRGPRRKQGDIPRS